MKRDRVSFWGDHLGFIDVLLDSSHSKRALLLQQKLAAARTRLACTDPSVRAVLVMLNPAYNWRELEAPYPCPVCGDQAVLTGEYHANRTLEWDGPEGNEVVADPQFYIESFSCHICGLTLFGRELDDADIGPLIDVDWDVDLDEVDPEDLAPDEDIARDR